MAGTVSASLYSTLVGLYADYWNRARPRCLEIATPREQTSYLYQRQSLASSLLPDDRKPARKGTPKTAYTFVNVGYNRTTVALSTVLGGYGVITEREMASLTAENPSLDPLLPLMRAVTAPVEAQLLADFQTAATALTSAGTMALTTASFDLKGAILDAVRAIQVATGIEPMTSMFRFHCGPTAADLMLNLNQVRDGFGIAFGTTSGGEQRTLGVNKTGDYKFRVLSAWFREVLGVELVVDSFVKINSSGTNVFANTTLGTLAMVNEADGAQTAMVTAYQPGKGMSFPDEGNLEGVGSGSLVSLRMGETQLPAAPGTGVAADAAYVVDTADSNLARKFTLTIA